MKRYPTLTEFRKSLRIRGVEADLVSSLEERTQREQRAIERVGEPEVVTAVIEGILPCDVPARALGAFVDAVFDKQLGRADDPAGLLPRGKLIPAGFQVVNEESGRRHGRNFSDLSGDEQDLILASAERGELQGPQGFDSGVWFKRLRDLILLGFGSDPRGMVQMGFPGPSYKPGHLWLDRREVRSRANRKKGYLKL
jgi:hypothetical protein